MVMPHSSAGTPQGCLFHVRPRFVLAWWKQNTLVMSRRTAVIAAALSLIALGPSCITANAKPNSLTRQLYSSGQAKQKQGDYKGAIADFTKVLEINPQDAKAYNERGIAKNGLKDYLGAIADFTKAIEINPRDAYIYFDNRAGVKVEIGDYRGVVFDTTKTIEINPSYTNAYERRGIAKQYLGDDRGACADYKKAVSLGDESAAQWLKSEGGTWCRNLR